MEAGTDTSRDPLWAFSEDHDAVLLLPRERWWTAYFSTNHSIYVDICTPPSWNDSTTIATFDLDLDVFVSPDGKITVLDVDEFRTNQDRYPPELVEGAVSGLAEVLRVLVLPTEIVEVGWQVLAATHEPRSHSPREESSYGRRQ